MADARGNSPESRPRLEMSELLSVLETLEADVVAGRPAVFCAVLEKRGSAPREPGAVMLVRDDGSTVGTVGGGAMEVAATRAARGLLPGGRATLLELSLDEDYGVDDTSICGGWMAIGLVPVSDMAQFEPFQHALDAARRHESAQIPIAVERAGQRVAYRLHVEAPPTLLIAGAGHMAQAVARLALGVGFRVVVVDDRTAIASPTRFDGPVELRIGDIARTLRDYSIDPSCYVAIMTRGHRHDQEALEAVIQRRAAYIGMIASRRKAATLLKALADQGVPEELIERVHTPIGLSIGATTVNEIAVSIVAQLIEVRRRDVPKVVERTLPTENT
jgi:xanthine dehydrogenase accessory factor